MQRIYQVTGFVTAMIATALLISVAPVIARTQEHNGQEKQQSEYSKPAGREMHQKMMQHMRTCMKKMDGEEGSAQSGQSPMSMENMQQMRERMMKHMESCMEKVMKEGGSHMQGNGHETKMPKPEQEDAKHDHNHGK